MPTTEIKSPEITRAAERYLEQYGDPLVMNTYLKVTILVLCAICLMLGALVFKSQKALVGMKPLVIRINDVGHADAIDYRNYQYKPQEAENKSDVQQAVIRQEQQNKTITNFQQDSTLPYVDINIKSVILDDLRQSPYSARIEFEKVYTNASDHTELKKERWTASVTYVFAEHVENNALAYNPLGVTIVRYRADQAFD
jgi:type IV secretion system protein VirB5